MAARRASDVYDYGEAVRLLQQALKVQEVLDPNDKAKQCDLLTGLGVALSRTLQQDRAVSVEYAQALVLADEMADRKRAAMICYRAARAVYSKGTATHGSRELLQWSEKADHYADQGTIERGWVDYNLGQLKCIRGIQEEGLPLIRRAIASARTYGNRELLMNACMVWAYFGQMPWSDVREGLQIAEETATGGTVDALLGSMGTFLVYGRREKAEDVARAVRELAATTGAVHYVALSHLVEYAFALWDGRLDEAVELLERDVAYHKEIGLQGNAYAAVIGFRTMLHLQGADDKSGSSLWKVILEEWGVPVFRRIPLLQAHLGQLDEANQKLDRMLKARPNITSTDDMTQGWLDVEYLESAVLVGHRQTAELLLQRFANNTMSTTSFQHPTCVPRHLGGAAALLGRYDEARRHYTEAIRVCTEMRFRPELALSRLQMAELLLEHYPDEKKDALDHLDFAIKEFREMKMQPSLERALRHKEILKA